MDDNTELCSRGRNYIFLTRTPYSLYRVVPVTLDAGERPFKELRIKKKENHTAQTIE